MKVEKKPILFSGMQPTGQLNMGGYLGAIKHWLRLQATHRCFFCLVDLHAMTVRHEPAVLKTHCLRLLALYIACGLDPDQHALFLQSHLPGHTMLAWILSCHAPLGELQRMTQFKDKSRQHAKHINAGLFTYPVLMAADILLYQAQTVPVGEDQKQHLELTREIAARFNRLYGPHFTLPEPCIPRHGGRIMALQSPTKKMSKSDPLEKNTLGLLDTPDQIRKKIARAVTDSLSQVKYDVDRPGISNLLTLYALVTDRPIAQLEAQYAGKGYGVFKADLSDAMVAFLSPIQARYAALLKDKGYLDAVLRQGADRAMAHTQPFLDRIKVAVGLVC